jgi:hypothetical protein
MDSSFYWERVGRADIDDVIALHPSEIHGILFYNAERRVHPDEISGNKYSLALIRPSNTVIRVKRWDGEHPKVSAIFTHMGIRYSFIRVADPVFTKRYQTLEDGDYPIQGVYFVVSLADPNPDDGYHWKLVATVFDE